MSKITLLATAAGVLILIGIETWLSIETLAPSDQPAAPTISPLYMTTTAKGLPTSPRYDHHSSD